jgi:L-rhamnose mutarotase
MKTKQIIMTCDLVSDPDIIEAYKKYHSKEYIWPEVNKAAEVSGYESIEIFLSGNRLVMIITYPENMNIDEINERYANADKIKMQEWSDLMSSFQKTPPGADSTRTWAQMEQIYCFKK